ncbi:caspase-8-like [Chrysoperla carnea]|uniref:caspase-8-like n=1 Tax=Chrysoperla carnea TaxID=189513 RepID=UPI001D06CF8E|nr:caspase-8-like [Chrysoperla carnea]
MIGINRNNYRSDASFSAPPSIQSPIIPLPLTFESINRLEEDLDFYEIVSLVFLLYDNAHTALEQLSIAKVTAGVTGNQVGLISEWVRSVQNNNPKWQETLLEALTNVQCYKVLRKLEFSKVEMKERFLPLNYECTINLHPVKKALYRLCEDLDKDVIDTLVKNVQCDLMAQNEQQSIFTIDNQYLEMHILNWMSKRYINIAYDNTNDLTKLINLIEQLNLGRLFGKRLEASVSRANQMYEELLATTFRKKLVLDKSRNNPDSMTSLCSYYEVDETKRYKMDPEKAGLVIIINQKNFKCNNIEDRTGTDFDRDRLKNVWEMFGFKVVVHEDLDFLDIQKKIEESIDKDFNIEYCCLVVIILSHGENGAILGVDGERADIDVIVHKIKKKKKLLDIPKILMIQACQGTMRERAIPLSKKTGNEKENCDEEENLTDDSPSSKKEPTAMVNGDFYQIIATTPGYSSVRDKTKGTWLIQNFCEALEENGSRDHFEDIILTTKSKIREKRWSGTGMVPVVGPNTLSKYLYFIPVHMIQRQ